MQISDSQKDAIRILISYGKTEEAVEALLFLKNEFNEKEKKQIELVAGRYYRWKDKDMKGLNRNETEIRKIDNSILMILSPGIMFKLWDEGIVTKKVKSISLFTFLSVLFLFVVFYFTTSSSIKIGSDNIKAGRDVNKIYNTYKNNRQVIHPYINKPNDEKPDSSEKAKVYIYRRKVIASYLIKDVIELSGTPIEKISAGEKKILELPSGTHKLDVKSINGVYSNELVLDLKQGDSISIVLSHHWYLCYPKLKLLGHYSKNSRVATE